MSFGWVASSHPAFNLHTFRPWDFSLNSGEMALFQIGATSRFTCFLVHLSDSASKSATRAVTARHRARGWWERTNGNRIKEKHWIGTRKKLTAWYSDFVALPPPNAFYVGDWSIVGGKILEMRKAGCRQATQQIIFRPLKWIPKVRNQ